MRHQREDGAALLVVLLMVAAMSAIAVGVLDSMRRSQRLWSNASSQSQAQWYALGAEAYVRVMANDLRDRGMAEAAFLSGEQSVAFPLDNGMMGVRVRDGSSCINLNGVVSGAGDIFERNDAGAAQLNALMVAIGIPGRQADELVESLVGWIDSQGGGPDRDDAPYLNMATAYLTPGEPLAEVSELRAIQGFTPEIYGKLRPFVCALPRVGPGQININALSPEHAPVLVALMEGRITLAMARDALAARPDAGWLNLGAFWSQPSLAGATAPDSVIAQTELEPRYLDVVVEVSHRDADVTLTQHLVQSNGDLVSHARRWSLDP